MKRGFFARQAFLTSIAIQQFWSQLASKIKKHKNTWMQNADAR